MKGRLAWWISVLAWLMAFVVGWAMYSHQWLLLACASIAGVACMALSVEWEDHQDERCC